MFHEQLPLSPNILWFYVHKFHFLAITYFNYDITLYIYIYIVQ
jgi:hypothetical protein